MQDPTERQEEPRWDSGLISFNGEDQELEPGLTQDLSKLQVNTQLNSNWTKSRILSRVPLVYYMEKNDHRGDLKCPGRK